MEEQKGNRQASGESDGNQSETAHLFNIFPKLVWHQILARLLDNTQTYYILCQTFPSLHSLISSYRTQALFSDVIAKIVQRLEYRVGSDSDHLQLTDLTPLRLVSRSWRKSVDLALQNLSYNYQFPWEHRLPDSEFLKDLAYEFGYRFCNIRDYAQFKRHFFETHAFTGKNPFITRRIIVQIPDPLQNDHRHFLACLDMLQSFGQHVWHLHFAANLTLYPNTPRAKKLFSMLKNILQLLPNLRVLKLENSPPTSASYTVKIFEENENYAAVPRMPEVSYVIAGGSSCYGFSSGRRTAEPELRTEQVVDQYGDPTQVPVRRVVNPPLLQNIRIVPQPVQNPPVRVNRAGSFANMMRQLYREPNSPPPRLPHLRYVNQEDVPFDIFYEMVQQNTLTVTQVGVHLQYRKEIEKFFELPLKLVKLSISASSLTFIKWSDFVFLLESRFGETLENLHIWWRSQPSQDNDSCQLLTLPKLKVLHLRHYEPTPLDFLLGVVNTLEELHVKIHKMNYRDSLRIQRAEQNILFYCHLNDLTRSNIWTLFPKLRLVRLSNVMEIENMTPVWKCTREQWKAKNQ